jgi:phage terminase Nu1 subunit (DNA packaging protein)
MQGEILNLDQASRVFGRSVNTLRSWINQGCPASRADNAKRNWQIRGDEFLEWRERQAFEAGQRSVGAAPAAPPPAEQAGPGDGEQLADKDEADRRRAWAQARTAELEYALKSGAVATIADTVKPFLEFATAIRAGLSAERENSEKPSPLEIDSLRGRARAEPLIMGVT